MYESLCEMTLDEIEGVSILGPDKHIAKKANSKLVQLTELKEILPVVDFKICKDFDTLLETTKSLWKKWHHGIFVTKEYSAAGLNSVVAQCQEEIIKRFKSCDDGTFIISRYLPHPHDPTVLGVVANKNDVYIAGVADQRIENHNRFTGSTFPTILSSRLEDKLKTLTRKAGKWLAGIGYRGIFGCDYIVTKNNDIRFLEINARKQSTTLEFCCTLEQNLPALAPNLPELEFYAVTQSRFPKSTVEMKTNSNNLHWGTFNYKIHNPVRTESYIPQAVGEREA
ncbi:MAG: ATP-grasp domain-containing protein, partial [Desulfobacteraceae bacterium]|nr:ATP-grasp domain-containing protein [Desulfobacteraceae bacterium]